MDAPPPMWSATELMDQAAAAERMAQAQDDGAERRDLLQLSRTLRREAALLEARSWTARAPQQPEAPEGIH